MNTPNEILENLHVLLSNNVIGDKQLMSRYKGFKGELDFVRDKLPSKTLKGGTLISKDSFESSLINSIYFTVLSKNENLDSYVRLYSKLYKIGFDKMIVVVYDNKIWENKDVMIYESERISLPVPHLETYYYNDQLKCFEFVNDNIEPLTNFFKNVKSRSKNSYPIQNSSKLWLLEKLRGYPIDELIDLYINRLVFDGYIGFSKHKGKPSDIDFIAINKKDEIILIEVKEKDLPKKAKKGFGLDVPRIKDFLKIQKLTGLDYYLVVRHIDNQRDRKLVEWLRVSIHDFVKDVKGSDEVEGGTGMRASYSSNPTLICSYDRFDKF